MKQIDLYKTLQDIEERYIFKALDKAKGNKSEAARLLMLNRTTYLMKLQKLLAEGKNGSH